MGQRAAEDAEDLAIGLNPRKLRLAFWIYFIGGLLAISGWQVWRIRDDRVEARRHAVARERAQADMVLLRQAIMEYQSQRGEFPDSLAALARFAVDRGALPEVDPWGTPYELTRTPENIRVRSFAADGLSGGFEDGVDLEIVIVAETTGK
ncbi:MAG: hypothetical protein ACKVX7_12340 [Planctomycetota bacterium]